MFIIKEPIYRAVRACRYSIQWKNQNDSKQKIWRWWRQRRRWQSVNVGELIVSVDRSKYDKHVWEHSTIHFVWFIRTQKKNHLKCICSTHWITFIVSRCVRVADNLVSALFVNAALSAPCMLWMSVVSLIRYIMNSSIAY